MSEYQLSWEEAKRRAALLCQGEHEGRAAYQRRTRALIKTWRDLDRERSSPLAELDGVPVPGVARPEGAR